MLELGRNNIIMSMINARNFMSFRIKAPKTKQRMQRWQFVVVAKVASRAVYAIRCPSSWPIITYYCMVKLLDRRKEG